MAGWSAVLIDLVLCIAKILAGVFFASRAILADGLHTASDLVTDVAVLFGVGASEKPPDGAHHYGHRRIATLISMFVGLAIMGAGAWIAYSAIISFNRPYEPVRGYMPLAMAALSVVCKEFLFRISRSAGRRSSNMALLANAWHHRTDVFTSLAATAGLAGVAIGGPRWQFLDSLTAAVLAAFLLGVAWRIIAGGASELTDRAPGGDVLEKITHAISSTPGVRSYHKFRARRSGGKISADVHVQVDPQLTVRQGHDIASDVRRRVMETCHDVTEVIVHVEPAESGRA